MKAHTLDEYREALRRLLGPEGRFRIHEDGTIRCYIGAWVIYGRVGDRATERRLFSE